MRAQKIFVIGAGVMGSGIVQACAQAGYDVEMMDIEQSSVKKAWEQIGSSLDILERKGQLKESKRVVMSRIKQSSNLEDASGSDFVIEAVIETLEAKLAVFTRISQVCKATSILATNTSSIPITDIAAAVKCPERVIGLHFFNPVHRMKLVEIVKGLMTAESTLASAKEFVFSISKEPVIVSKDSAGFIVNRINGMTFLEALRLLDRGIATAEDIDKAMRLGLGHPMGPFELMDLVGLDVVLNARMGIFNETRDPNHFPPDILRRMVQAGHLGRKTKKGFYEYC